MAALANIALSASTIVLQNKFKAERDPKEKCTYFITNKSRYSRRIRVSLSDKTDSVSLCHTLATRVFFLLKYFMKRNYLVYNVVIKLNQLDSVTIHNCTEYHQNIRHL